MSRQELTAVEAKKGIEGVILSKAFLSRIQQVAASTISPERLARVFLATTTTNPTLLKCSRESIALSLMRCAVVGLEPDGVMGEAYLVPYYDSQAGGYQAQYQPGFKGLCKLARQSGEVADIWAEVVYEGDVFEEEKGMSPKIVHKPCKPSERGALMAAYACCRFRDGLTRARVVYEDEINKVKDQVRRRSRKKELTTPWIEHEPEMWKKTAIIRLCKTLPASVAKAVDDATHDDAGGDILDGSFTIASEPQAALPDHLDAILEQIIRAKDEQSLTKIYDAAIGPDATVDLDDNQRRQVEAARADRLSVLREGAK